MMLTWNEEIEDPPPSLRSPVWDHYGFPVKDNNGERNVDKMHVVCCLCTVVLKYNFSNTSNMITYLKRHRKEWDISGAKRKKICSANTAPFGF